VYEHDSYDVSDTNLLSPEPAFVQPASSCIGTINFPILNPEIDDTHLHLQCPTRFSRLFHSPFTALIYQQWARVTSGSENAEDWCDRTVEVLE